MKFKIERICRGSIDGYDVNINIDEDGLNKFEFVNKISKCIDGFKDCNIYISTNKINLSFLWSIYALYNSNKYYYGFTTFGKENNEILYNWNDLIDKKDINKIVNYLARDVDEVIKEYEILMN